MEHYTEFLPIRRADMEARGWDQLDFVVVGGDAYVDHPSFGTAIISRLLEAEGYKVGVLAQPRYTDCEDFKRFGKPKYGFFIGGGNVDSMVSHYSVAKIPRAEDEYSPGGKGGARPDRSATVYTRLAKQAYPDLPVILGGLEASLRRFAHYDYWLDTVLPSIAEDSGADIISFGMGEHQTVEIARRLAAGEPVESITDVDGTCYLTDFDHLPERYVECAGFKKVASDKVAYAKACRIQMDNQDVVSGQIIVQKQSEKYLVQNIPAKPLVRWELDKVYALPYPRRYHPIYEAMGGVPAIREVQFSIIQNRGCFGGCNFCAIQLHQGRRVTSRSADSIVAEAERMTHEPDFKGYIHDIGGPTANFRFPSCREQMLRGMCNGGKHCLAPTTCSHMIVDHSDYLKILRRVRELPGVKKVFIRSGIRFDYLMADPDDTFFKELVEYHVSGQLKVAPEHCAPNTLPHPAQDSALHLARSVKKWGTPQYSNGYICRNPHRNNQMHHYDMNLCYIDELLWHFKWTGDLDYVRQMWPVITRHLAWEKLNYDPDNDGLYDAYACIWASDALYYNSGAVTHSSAYNYRANKTAAQLAEKIGEDPTPYRNEAEKILKAMNERLWLPGKGHWAEYQDFMGHKRVHESAAVWTIYHAIDSETANPFQAYQATRYVDTSIPHIPVTAYGLKENGYATIATTNWLPYSWSINNVAFAEVMHTALSYFQAGRADAGYKLLKSSVLDGMYLGDSPGNFGQISFYDAARGECYRDFGDPIGVASRVLIQGLFGILPDALNQQIILRPGFPDDWDKASVSTPDISYRFTRKENTDTYHITQRFQTPLHPVLHVNARKEKIRSVKVNGVPATWQSIESAHGYPLLSIQAEGTSSTTITIEWEGAPLHTLAVQEPLITSNGKLALQIPSGASISQVYDPQSILANHTVEATAFNAQIKGEPGHHTFFVYTHQGEMDWWQPVNIYIENVRESPSYTDFADIRPEKCRMVDFDRQLNASVTDIYQNEYLSPRSPYTTLQLPTQGIGEWCHPLLSATIDDSELRSLVHHDTFQTSLGIPFRLKEKGNNILFTSLWDNYPDSSTISLSGTASHAYLLMAGSTNHMQCHIANGIIRIHYADGTSQATELTNPDNWCPIEQDFYVDGKAFQVPAPRPYRLHLKSGKVSRDLGKELNITGVYGREIEGGAGILLDIPLDHSKELKGLTLETLSNDVVIGIMGVTLQ